MKRWFIALALIFLPLLSQANDPTEWPKEIIDYYHLLTMEENRPVVELPQYKMFMKKGDGGLALLNDKFVSVGDHFEDFKVESVDKSKVILKDKYGRLETIQISSGSAKASQADEEVSVDEEADEEHEDEEYYEDEEHDDE